MIETTITANTWLNFKGLQAYDQHGKPLMKCIGILRTRAGEKLHWKNKPGWIDGELKEPKVYDEWFERVNF